MHIGCRDAGMFSMGPQGTNATGMWKTYTHNLHRQGSLELHLLQGVLPICSSLALSAWLPPFLVLFACAYNDPCLLLLPYLCTLQPTCCFCPHVCFELLLRADIDCLHPRFPRHCARNRVRNLFQRNKVSFCVCICPLSCSLLTSLSIPLLFSRVLPFITLHVSRSPSRTLSQSLLLSPSFLCLLLTLSLQQPGCRPKCAHDRNGGKAA